MIKLKELDKISNKISNKKMFKHEITAAQRNFSFETI
jgi:hypothetical protein